MNVFLLLSPHDQGSNNNKYNYEGPKNVIYDHLINSALQQVIK